MLYVLLGDCDCWTATVYNVCCSLYNKQKSRGHVITVKKKKDLTEEDFKHFTNLSLVESKILLPNRI